MQRTIDFKLQTKKNKWYYCAALVDFGVFKKKISFYIDGEVVFEYDYGIKARISSWLKRII